MLVWPSKRSLHILFVLFWILTSCENLQSYPTASLNSYIDEKRAIELAKEHCENAHSTPQEAEHNIEAVLLTCKEVSAETGWDACDSNAHPDAMVWYISMNGLWFHFGPPNPDGTNSDPIPFTECKVIMDASTGALFELGSE